MKVDILIQRDSTIYYPIVAEDVKLKSTLKEIAYEQIVMKEPLGMPKAPFYISVNNGCLQKIISGG